MRVALICMPFDGHFNRCRPVLAELIAADCVLAVYTDDMYADEVRRLGASFVNLFGPGRIEELGDDSIPSPVRLMTWAARHAAATIAAVRACAPELIICDDFSVVAQIVGVAIGVPIVVARSQRLPQRRPGQMAYLHGEPRVRPSWKAVNATAQIVDRCHLPNDTPTSFWAPPDLGLNLVNEPPEFVTAAERSEYPSIRCFGSVLPTDALQTGDSVQFPAVGTRRLYVAFGTFVWTYWADRAMRSIAAISGAIARLPGWSALVSLGGAQLEPERVAAVEHDRLRVAAYVDQWAALSQADAFVTHHGLNSTHEAVYREVPMLSHPFTVDQPGKAQICQALDLAIPLLDADQDRLTEEGVLAALERLDSSRERLRRGLRRARGWEDAVIARRPHIVRELLALARPQNLRV